LLLLLLVGNGHLAAGATADAQLCGPAQYYQLTGPSSACCRFQDFGAATAAAAAAPAPGSVQEQLCQLKNASTCAAAAAAAGTANDHLDDHLWVQPVE
jgi:hypothetical protein